MGNCYSTINNSVNYSKANNIYEIREMIKEDLLRTSGNLSKYVNLNKLGFDKPNYYTEFFHHDNDEIKVYYYNLVYQMILLKIKYHLDCNLVPKTLTNVENDQIQKNDFKRKGCDVPNIDYGYNLNRIIAYLNKLQCTESDLNLEKLEKLGNEVEEYFTNLSII